MDRSEIDGDRHLEVARRLREAGFNDAQAEAVADAVREGAEGTELVTKSDLALRTAELRSEIAALGSELRGEIADLGSELRAEIAAMRSDLGRRLPLSKPTC